MDHEKPRCPTCDEKLRRVPASEEGAYGLSGMDSWECPNECEMPE